MSTKEELLNLFEHHPEKYLSGQKIGDTLHVSRNAIWKAVEQLRSEGYIIDSKPKSGYMLIEKPDILSPFEITMKLKYPCRLKLYDKVTSTITVAEQAEPSDTPLYIVADSQTNGQGRLGRSFASPAGSGLYLTLSVKRDFSIDQALYVTMASAVATARAIEKVCKVHVDIKWVNDLFYKGKKVCGILTKAQTNLEIGQISKIIIGIGINCFPGNLPPELEKIAGYISGEAGSFPRNELAAEVFNQTMAVLEELDSREFMQEYRDRCFILGRLISVHPHLDERSVKAYALDIDDHGGLVVRYAEGEHKGEIATLTTGEVSIRLP